ncbi:MAG TPA: hypothetical protein VF591_25540 [Pyrinomonadaceae bacterium]|jgi:hypothetical protein
MTNKLTKGLEVSANVAIIVVAVLLCVVLVKSYVIPAPAARQAAGEPAGIRGALKRGDAVAVLGIDWQKNGKTLLLALSTACHFCTESGPFYQRLVRERGETRLVALVPQAEEEGQAYLRGLGVGIDEVRHIGFRDMGLTGTPTLLLVDEKGVVSDVWVGRSRRTKRKRSSAA